MADSEVRNRAPVDFRWQRRRSERTAPKEAEPTVCREASVCTIRSPYGESLRNYLLSYRCPCQLRPLAPIQGYDFLIFPPGTDFPRVKALLQNWLNGADLRVKGGAKKQS